MNGTGPLIRPMTPADRSALASFPNRVSAGSAIFRFHGSVTMLTDKTLDLLLDLVEGQREAIAAVDDRGSDGVARFARDDEAHDVAEVAIPGGRRMATSRPRAPRRGHVIFSDVFVFAVTAVAAAGVSTSGPLRLAGRGPLESVAPCWWPAPSALAAARQGDGTSVAPAA